LIGGDTTGHCVAITSIRLSTPFDDDLSPEDGAIARVEISFAAIRVAPG